MKFIQTENSKCFFSADPHVGHKNICAGVTNWLKPEQWPVPYSEWRDNEARGKFCREHGLRDFPTIEVMNETIIERFNEKVGQDDNLFLLGDLAFGGVENIGKFMKRLVCKNVWYVTGNHDKNILFNRDGAQGHFKSCEPYKEIVVDEQFIVLCHYAMRAWNHSHKSSWMLYGHNHGKLEHTPWGKSMDVGVDTNDMYPYSFEDIKEIMDKREIMESGHHRE